MNLLAELRRLREEAENQYMAIPSGVAKAYFDGKVAALLWVEKLMSQRHVCCRCWSDRVWWEDEYRRLRCEECGLEWSTNENGIPRYALQRNIIVDNSNKVT